MAHRTESDEPEFKVASETMSLCVNCGISASSTVDSLCQKCIVSTAAGAKSINPVFSDESSRSSSSASSPPMMSSRILETRADLKDTATEAEATPVKRSVNRCSGCRRKVGLTGFRCRCGELFCAEHRYSDRHDCSYDYKGAGREAIARENPVVKATKLVRI